MLIEFWCCLNVNGCPQLCRETGHVIIINYDLLKHCTTMTVASVLCMVEINDYIYFIYSLDQTVNVYNRNLIQFCLRYYLNQIFLCNPIREHVRYIHYSVYIIIHTFQKMFKTFSKCRLLCLTFTTAILVNALSLMHHFSTSVPLSLILHLWELVS